MPSRNEHDAHRHLRNTWNHYEPPKPPRAPGHGRWLVAGIVAIAVIVAWFEVLRLRGG